jgi:hypothetical protein
MGRSGILPAVAVAALAIASRAGAAPPVTVLSPETLKVSTHDAKPTTITLRNDGGGSTDVDLTTMLEEGSATVAPPRVTIGGHEVKQFKVTIAADSDDRDTTGELLLTASGAAPAAVPLVIEPNNKAWDDGTALLIICPLLAAAVIVVARLATVDVTNVLGPANWDYSQSWATSLTLVGALLGTVLGAGVLPDKLDLFTKAGYSAFNVLFGMLVLAAPLFYTALQTRGKDAAGRKQQYEGTIWAFGVASIATLWGVFGQLATVGLLFREIEKAGNLSTVLVTASWIVLGLIAVAAGVYSARRMQQIVAEPTTAEEGVAPRTAAGTWSLL